MSRTPCATPAQEPLRCIVVGERLAHDVGDYPRLGKRIYRNDGEPWELVDHADIESPGPGTGTGTK